MIDTCCHYGICLLILMDFLNVLLLSFGVWKVVWVVFEGQRKKIVTMERVIIEFGINRVTFRRTFKGGKPKEGSKFGYINSSF